MINKKFIRRLSCIGACSFLLLGLAGCGNTKESSTSSSDIAVSSSSVNDTSSENEVLIEIGKEPVPIPNASRIDSYALIPKDQLPYEGEDYCFDNISLVIPDSWKDRYYIFEDKTGFSFYQTMSYDIREGSGLLFTLNKYEGLPDYINSGYVIAYTPKYSYVVEFPSDIPCEIDIEECKNNYFDLYDELNTFLYSLNIDEEYVTYACSEYIYPMSEYVELNEATINSKTLNNMLLGKYEIYARHGKEFTKDIENGLFLSDYFEGMSWYQVNPDYSDADLSDVEKRNIKAIDKCIDEIAANMPKPMPIQLNESFEADLDGDGKDEKILYTSDEEASSEYNSEEIFPVLTIDNEEYKIWDYEQFGAYYEFPLETAYLVDIIPDKPGMEIAIQNNGCNDYDDTHFYTIDDNGTLVYLGYVDGMPCQNFLYTFGEYGVSITTETNTFMLGNGNLTAYSFYNYDEKKIEHMTNGFLPYQTSREMVLMEDLPVYLTNDAKDSNNPYMYTFSKGDKIWPVATDNASRVKIKNSHGVYGIIYITDDDTVEILNKSTTEIFDGIIYAG